MAGLRDYQQQMHSAIMSHIKKTLAACVAEAATGAGKSHNIAALANEIHKISKGKRVLCLQPSAELVEQNYEKYLLTGNPASLFSASAGPVSMRHPIIFGTPGTVKNRISRFGGDIAAVIVDECHEITPTIQHIIEKVRELNPQVRVIGFSATPYRLKTGYIYAIDENGKSMPESSCADPYFTKRVYTVKAPFLIDKGWLTPPVIGEINSGHYDTLAMSLNGNGKFKSEDVDRAYHGHGRKTAAIVGDVINQSKYRKGVMFFAATVQHAEEVYASLPPEISAILTALTGKTKRKKIIASFKRQEIKYLVNVGVLTRGFDADHVDVIAILRATESVALLQQIIGRGLRIREGKEDCLILDYAENIDRHCPDGDVFNPKIKAGFISSEKAILETKCPECSNLNEFSARRNPEKFPINKNGYFIDLEGLPIETDMGPMPAHHGRRCLGLALVAGEYRQCDYRWTFKACPHCDGDNDIAARYCSHCKGEIIDPNEKLRIEFKAMKRNAAMIQTDEIISMSSFSSVSAKGNETIRIDIVTPYRKFSVWLMPGYSSGPKAKDLAIYNESTNYGDRVPLTVTYKKDAETGFYKVYDYDRPKDEAP